MKWFRSNIRHGARLALFALLVQLALSFGHSHWFAQAAPLHPAAAQQGSSTQAAAPRDRVAISKPSPAHPDQDQPGDDHCAICAVVAMAGTIVLAGPPLLMLPRAVELLYRTTDAEFVHLKSAGRAFQPRAPPAS
jgi:hypothetical protein